MTPVTVGELRQVMESLPDEAGVIVEAVEDGLYGWQFKIMRAFGIGQRTDDPGLVLKVVRSR